MACTAVLQVTLLKLLQAYEAVLKKHNISPNEDTYYYRLLLKLSLEPSPDWWGKFYRECELNARYTPQSRQHEKPHTFSACHGMIAQHSDAAGQAAAELSIL